MAQQPVGYSGTPLARKLGIGPGAVVAVLGEPPEYRSWLEPVPDGVVFSGDTTTRTDVTHLFVTRRAELDDLLGGLRHGMRSDASIWVSWPKKASRVPTDVTEDTVREVALPLGLVDVKVCAVSEVWSALKLVIRKELR
ncbi:MAG: hypothetical protein RL375_3634 [Pseudomonadota bacterium]